LERKGKREVKEKKNK